MARYDKYDGVSGGFRVRASADQVGTALYGVPTGVGIDANGLGTLGVAEQTGYKGVCIIDATKRKANDVLDVMTHGEIVYDTTDAGLTAGTDYYLDANGALTTAAPAAGVNGYYVGHTVEAWRLIVRFAEVQG